MKANIALIKGDGIGPEVIDAALLVLDKASNIFNHDFHYTEVLAGGIAIDTFGSPLPDISLQVLKNSDAVLMGALGGPKWDNCTERPEKALLAIRKGLGLYANLRPAKLFSSMKAVCPLKNAENIDLIVVRELTGGIYYGERGLRRGKMGLEAFDTESYGELEIERIAQAHRRLAQCVQKN